MSTCFAFRVHVGPSVPNPGLEAFDTWVLRIHPGEVEEERAPRKREGTKFSHTCSPRKSYSNPVGATLSRPGFVLSKARPRTVGSPGYQGHPPLSGGDLEQRSRPSPNLDPCNPFGPKTCFWFPSNVFAPTRWFTPGILRGPLEAKSVSGRGGRLALGSAERLLGT